MVSEESNRGQQIVVRRTSSDTNQSEKKAAMKEKDDDSKILNVKGEVRNEETQPTEVQPGLLSRISGGVYSKAATVVGGVGWVAGTALSTTYSAVTTVGGVAFTPFRKSQKDKSD